MRAGLPAFTIVGLADPAVREARERIRTAIRNCGFEFPARRITVNLAPGDLPKAGPGLDLAIACAVLCATGQAAEGRLRELALFGELSLDGRVRPAQGTLAVAQAARRCGLGTLVLASSRAREAALVDGLRVAPVSSLSCAARFLDGAPAGRLPPPAPAPAGQEAQAELDLADVRGCHEAVEAIVVAAAGAHNVLLIGPPGTGKTMIARRLPTILPPLGREEAIEVTRIHSLARGEQPGLARRRPFRAPHHTATAAGLVGGARAGWIGEAVLAHRGVLFLDELSLFSRAALEALRQPLEDGHVTIARARRAVTHPARFMLVAATNPCPCGHGGDGYGCRCSAAELARHDRRLSGPLLDRVDLQVALQRSSDGELDSPPLTASARARERVADARERQAARLRGEPVSVNAEMDARMLATHARLDGAGERILGEARRNGLLGARGQDRVLRVARTIADLGGRERVQREDLAAAIAMRCAPGRDGGGMR